MPTARCRHQIRVPRWSAIKCQVMSGYAGSIDTAFIEEQVAGQGVSGRRNANQPSRTRRRYQCPHPIHIPRCPLARWQSVLDSWLPTRGVAPETHASIGIRHLNRQACPGCQSAGPFTIKSVPVSAFSGRPPSAGGLNRSSRQVPVQVGGSNGSSGHYSSVSL